MTGHWYALVTRSRHERAVERALARLEGVETYVPLRRVWSSRVDRRVQIYTPALPGYVFLRAVLWPDIRASIKRTPGVVAFVGCESQPARIPPEQIESLRIMLACSTDVEVLTKYEPGQPVQITRGPLAGARGVLIRTNPSRHRLVVRIEQIGLALSADVHEADVEPLDNASSSRLQSDRTLCYSRVR
ncbi:MAG: UpxY family transcription antiterminator [Chthonomonadales bacterium]|nr:UpxY family transcription antiterminator [Chthonomonadales bacterium]